MKRLSLSSLGSNRAWRWGLVLLAAVSLAFARADDSLIEAVKKADAAGVRTLLDQDADVNLPDVDGTTALHWAAHLDDRVMAELLLGAGAKVDATNRYGVTPLSLACTNGSASMIEALLKAGANPNLAQPEGETPLMTAARTGAVAAVSMLIAHGADVNAKEKWRGQDALTWAAGEGHVAAARALIEQGADANARSQKGYTPLLFAARQGLSEMVELLLEAGANIDDVADSGLSALVAAIHNYHWDLANLLLEAGASPDIDATGSTPLHLAIHVRDPQVEFFEPKASTDELDSLDVIKALLARGADVNARMTKQFLGIAPPQDMPLPGATPFFLAARGADPTVMRLLLEHGADPLLGTTGRATPLMAAAGVGYEQGNSLRTEAEALEAVKLAFELGGDVNAANVVGWTALHGAAVRGANSIVEFLAEKGARLDAKDRAGRTPYVIAAEGAGDSQQRRQVHTAELLRELMDRTQ